MTARVTVTLADAGQCLLARSRATILVEVEAVDRDEFGRALILQGYAPPRAAEIAYGLPPNDGALQMLARHRIAATARACRA